MEQLLAFEEDPLAFKVIVVLWLHLTVQDLGNLKLMKL